MYNMNVSLLGYKISLEVLILIGVIYLILVGHTVCGCCNMHGIMEGLGNMGKGGNKGGSNKNSSSKGKSSSHGMSSHGQHGMSSHGQHGMSSHGSSSSGPHPIIAKAIMNKKEGFVGANTNYGESSHYSVNNYTPVDTSSWFTQNMVVTPGQPLSKGVQDVLNREPQPVPLPEGEMLMFANTPFKPECCPNTYSNSSGCACMTADQYNYLITRSGNNVPYSEY
jgi:hypothetical protein